MPDLLPRFWHLAYQALSMGCRHLPLGRPQGFDRFARWRDEAYRRAHPAMGYRCHGSLRP